MNYMTGSMYDVFKCAMQHCCVVCCALWNRHYFSLERDCSDVNITIAIAHSLVKQSLLRPLAIRPLADS